mmetsp:Transcript_43247/g.119586  ORF Transcript_43247/g.119586 Transcript_43247/m.119586 type:complete len:239 (-) Transcript_43247:190-906(-)
MVLFCRFSAPSSALLQRRSLCCSALSRIVGAGSSAETSVTWRQAARLNATPTQAITFKVSTAAGAAAKVATQRRPRRTASNASMLSPRLARAAITPAEPSSERGGADARGSAPLSGGPGCAPARRVRGTEAGGVAGLATRRPRVFFLIPRTQGPWQTRCAQARSISMVRFVATLRDVSKRHAVVVRVHALLPHLRGVWPRSVRHVGSCRRFGRASAGRPKALCTGARSDWRGVFQISA